MDSEAWKIHPDESRAVDTIPAPPGPPHKPYEVSFGYELEQTVSFATFVEVGAFLSGYLAGTANSGIVAEWRVVNTDKCDGAIDAHNPTGLTEDERDVLEGL